jgi:hypothetical protein
VNIWASSKNALADAIRELDVLAATTSPPQERTNGRNKKSQDVPNYPTIHPVSAKGKAIMLKALEELAKLDYYRQEPETANHYSSTVSLPILLCPSNGMLIELGYVFMAC